MQNKFRFYAKIFANLYGRVGYDVQYMDQDELIADMLKQYERYLSLLDDVGQELMAHEQTELAE